MQTAKILIRLGGSNSVSLHNLAVDMDRIKRIWCLSPMRAAKVLARLRGCAGSPEPSLLANTNSESRETFRQKARSLAPLNGWACAVKICHDGMLEDTKSLDRAHMMMTVVKPVLVVNSIEQATSLNKEACVLVPNRDQYKFTCIKQAPA